MFCNYRLTANCTNTHLASDFLALLTGETNKAILSAGCDKNNTNIITTVPAGWSLHDQVSATKFVIKAKEANGLIDKFVLFDFVSNAINMSVYETWNATTHVGTNQAASTSASHSVTFSANTSIYLAVKKEYIIFMVRTDNTWVNVSGASLEITRRDLWNTPSLGYPAHIFSYNIQTLTHAQNGGTYTRFHQPRLKGETADLTGTAAYLQIATPFGMTAYPMSTGATWTTYNILPGIARGANFNVAEIPVFDFNLQRYHSNTFYALGGQVLGGLKLAPATYGDMGDQLIHNDVTYFILSTLNHTNRNSLHLLIPKE